MNRLSFRVIERDAAVEAAVQAERADCARHIDARVAGWRNAENPEDETVNGYLAFAGQLLSHEIRARGPTDALAAALATARVEALEEAAVYLDGRKRAYETRADVAIACRDDEGIDVATVCAAMFEAAATAIRALAGEEQRT